ncbi:MAG: hypothetical protein AAFN77_20975 [Planctomycetota bacterium]
MSNSSWSIGDLVVYKKSKVSNAPGQRAKNVAPSTAGESYSYTVDKFWIIKEILPDGSLLVQTLRGKEHTLAHDDVAIRKPYLWERWFYRERFRQLTASITPDA